MYSRNSPVQRTIGRYNQIGVKTNASLSATQRRENANPCFFAQKREWQAVNSSQSCPPIQRMIRAPNCTCSSPSGPSRLSLPTYPRSWTKKLVPKRNPRGGPYNARQALARKNGCRNQQCAPNKTLFVPMDIVTPFHNQSYGKNSIRSEFASSLSPLVPFGRSRAIFQLALLLQSLL